MKIRKTVVLITIYISFSIKSNASDIVPYSIQSINSADAGYVELVGPGKILVNEKSLPYEGTIFVKFTNIGKLTSIKHNTKGCVLAYSSGSYKENISVLKQSCEDIISVIKKAISRRHELQER